jgi:hypothetical protein
MHRQQHIGERSVLAEDGDLFVPAMAGAEITWIDFPGQPGTRLLRHELRKQPAFDFLLAVAQDIAPAFVGRG